MLAAIAALLSIVTAAAVAAQDRTVAVDLYTLGQFTYVEPPKPTDPAAKTFTSSIPAAIRALDGKRVTIDGYVLPYVQGGGMTREFMLVRDYDNCRFGDPPTGMNDWIDVAMLPGRVAYMAERAQTVTGVLSVGEIFDRDGFVISIYRLSAESVR